MSRDYAWVPACPRKSSHDCVAAVFQGLWKITIHIWHQASPVTTLFSGVCWDWVTAQPLPNVFPSVEPLLLCGLRTSQTLLCSRGFTLPTRAPSSIELQSFRLCAPPVYRVLMEFKSFPFSFFSSVPMAVSTFPLSLQLLFGGGHVFPVLSPHLHPVSTSKNNSLPSVASLSPSSHLCTKYLLSSVV